MAINESPFSPVLSITIDKTPPPIPDVKVELASSTDFGKPKITFSSADSNISHYTVNINGEDKGIQTSPYNPVFTPLSINTIIITAYDIAGNSSSRTVKYPPVVNITASTIYSNSVINDSDLSMGPAFNVKVSFSKEMIGTEKFSFSDLSITNASVGSCSSTNNIDFICPITPNSSGDITIQVGANSV